MLTQPVQQLQLQAALLAIAEFWSGLFRTHTAPLGCMLQRSSRKPAAWHLVALRR
jgi:hypothetical protein